MEDNNKSINKNRYTLYGVLAALIWGSGNAFGRSLAESYGNFSSTGLSSLVAGVLSTAVQIKKAGIASYRKAPLRYWLLCGPLYVIYKLCANISIGVAANREQVITSGILRLMWPMMTLIVAVVMFRKENKVSRWFVPGILISILGILVANTPEGSISLLHTVKIMFTDAFAASALSLISSVAWGFYSNLNKKIVGNEDYDAVGLFMLITGVIAYAATIYVKEPQVMHLRQLGELFYIAILSNFVGALLWNLSMQKGDHIIVIFISNFLPVFSTVLSAVLLGVRLTVPVVLGSLMVVAGTVVCKACIKPVKAG